MTLEESTDDAQIFTTTDQFQPTITVGREMLPIAIQHGMELWWDDSTPQKRLDERDESSQFTRFVNSRIEGKLAEVALTNLLQQYFHVDSAVDWRIYGDYQQTDDGDLQHLLSATESDTGETTFTEHPLGTDIEVKKTKPWNSWLAIRDEIFERYDDDAPVVLTKLRLENDIQLDQWRDSGDWDSVDNSTVFRDRLLNFADAEFPLKVEFVGSVYPDEFTHHFGKGDYLFDPESGRDLGNGLKRPNYGIPVTNIPCTPQRWNRVVADVCQNAPSDIWDPLPIVEDIETRGNNGN